MIHPTYSQRPTAPSVLEVPEYWVNPITGEVV